MPKKTKDPDDPIRPLGIGLKESEWGRLEKIAEELGSNRHALAIWALRDFLRRYEAGEIETQTKKSLPGL